MRPLRAAVAFSLLTLPAGSAPTTFGWVGGPTPPSSKVDKNSDLIAKFDNPATRSAALAEVAATANKTASKVRTYLMKQVGSPDADVARAAMEAVISIGQPMTRAIKTVLKTGEYKDVPISDSVAARIALLIDPTGKRMLEGHVRTQPLTSTVAAEIRRHAEPQAALAMLVEKAHEEASRPLCLSTLRAFRQRGAFAAIEGLEDSVREQTEELDETLTQVVVDAVVNVLAEEDYPRMEAWLASGDPAQLESALWSIGGTGQPFMDLAPQLAAHLTSDTPSTREAAHWALRRFAADDSAVAPAEEPKAEPSKAELEERVFYDVMKGAQGGVLPLPGASIDPASDGAPTGVELAAEATAHWKFAPTWIAMMGSRFMDTEFGTAVPAWTNETVPSQIEELMPTLMAALASDDSAVAMPAGLSLIEWNVNTIDLLRWAVTAIGTATDPDDLHSIFSLIARESEQPWLKRTFATAAFTAALKNEAAEVPMIKLLTRMNTDATRKVLVKHLAASSSTRHWDAQHYLTLYSLMALNRDDRAKLSTVLGRRFNDGDYRVAPLLALAAESAHPALKKALASPVLDRRMIAVAILVEQGTRARALMPNLSKLNEDTAHARAFRDESVQTIQTGQ